LAVAKLLPEDALTSSGQCYAPKPLKFYNRKSKPSRLSMLDDSLIIKTLSVTNAPSVVPRCGGSTTSLPSIIVAQISLEGALGYSIILHLHFIRMASFITIR
jgi:hypothetical protein